MGFSRTRSLLLRAAGILLLAAGAVPLEASGVSSTGAQFLKIPVGVRAAAMGETFVAFADDVSTTHWNTAGLSRLTRYEIQFLHVSFFQSLNYEFLGVGLPIRPGSVVGLSAALDFVPSFNSTNDPLALPGEASDLAIALGFGQRFGEHLAFGVGGKFLQSKLAGFKATGMGLDAGILAYTSDGSLTLGLSVQNLGQVSSFDQFAAREELPATYRAGLAYRLGAGKPTNWALGADVEKGIDLPDPVFHAGSEFWWGVGDVGIAFRGGYEVSELDDDLGGNVGATFGTGVRLSSLQFDYALVPFGSLGNTHRFSMTYRFGGETRREDAVDEELGKKPVAVDIQPQVSDFRTGTLKAATFELKPEARTDIQSWSLEITDPQGKVVRRFTGRGVPPKQIQWDGRDDAGNVVTGGLFASYHLRTVDKRGDKVTTSEPIFQVSKVGLGLRGEELSARELQQDPRLLASLMGRLEVPEAGFHRPRLPDTLQPVGLRGALRVPSILFGVMSDRLEKVYYPYLDEVAELIRKHPNSRVYIEGHASAEGPEKVNYLLSQQRADAVLRYLVEKGRVRPESISARGHGSSAPLDTSGSEEARRRNRRVDIVILTQ